MPEKTHKDFESRIPEDARQHFQAAREEMRKTWEGMFPPGTVEHRRKARKEMLMAFRSLLDAALEKMDETKPS
jgi:hypothetical protein